MGTKSNFCGLKSCEKLYFCNVCVCVCLFVFPHEPYSLLIDLDVIDLIILFPFEFIKKHSYYLIMSVGNTIP